MIDRDHLSAVRLPYPSWDCEDSALPLDVSLPLACPIDASTVALVFYFLPLSFAAASLTHGRYDVVSSPSSVVSRGGNTVVIWLQLCWQLPLLPVLNWQFSAFLLNPNLGSQYLSWSPTSLPFRCYLSDLLISAAQKVWIPFRMSTTNHTEGAVGFPLY
jgi:hypothetical protein